MEWFVSEDTNPPIPKIQNPQNIETESWSCDKETASISVTVKNEGGLSSEGYISVSFPNGEEVVSVSGTSTAKKYPPGSTIHTSSGTTVSSDYYLAELNKSYWDEGESQTLNIEVKPNSNAESIVFYYRAALKNDAKIKEADPYERDPISSEHIDQQHGWYAYKKSVFSSPNLIIEDIKVDGNEISYKINNTGPSAAGSSKTYLYIDDMNNRVASDDVGLVSACGGSDEWHSFDYSYTCSGTDTIRVRADGESKVNEIDENDNDKTIEYDCTAKYGTLVVTIYPSEVRSQAKWRLTTETDWHSSGEEITVVTDDYTIEFSKVDGWAEPEDMDIEVSEGSNEAPATYIKDASPEYMVVDILSPTEDFEVDYGDLVLIKAKVTDNMGEPMPAAKTSRVCATFSNGDDSILLFDDGTHDDGLVDDGIYANGWVSATTSNNGTETDCMITVSAYHSTLGEANDEVVGKINDLSSEVPNRYDILFLPPYAYGESKNTSDIFGFSSKTATLDFADVDENIGDGTIITSALAGAATLPPIKGPGVGSATSYANYKIVDYWTAEEDGYYKITWDYHVSGDGSIQGVHWVQGSASISNSKVNYELFDQTDNTWILRESDIFFEKGGGSYDFEKILWEDTFTLTNAAKIVFDHFVGLPVTTLIPSWWNEKISHGTSPSFKHSEIVYLERDHSYMWQFKPEAISAAIGLQGYGAGSNKLYCKLNSVSVVPENPPYNPVLNMVDKPPEEVHNGEVVFSWEASDDISPKDKLQYSFYLEGYDASWSDWSKLTSKSYSNLHDGDYEFKIKVKDEHDHESPIVLSQFKVSRKLQTLISASKSASNPLYLYSGYPSEIETFVISGGPIEGANVLLSVTDGSNYLLSNLQGVTNENGNFVSIFNPPPVTSEHIYTILATVTKSGYASATDEIEVTVIPRKSYETPIGSKVSVEMTDEEVSLIFDDVEEGGETSAMKSFSGPSTPSGFILSGVYYNIESTATFEGPIKISINYDESQTYDELSLRLWHYENGNWVDITTSLDIDKNIIYGSTMSLSPFIVATPYNHNKESSEISSTTSSSGGGGGGGGGGTTGEEFENIAYKDVLSEFVSKGDLTSYEFDNELNTIEYIRFEAFRNWGKISSTIEMLHGTSALVDEDAPDTVYCNVNMWVGKSGFSSSDNIDSPVVGFKVEKDWVEEYEIDEGTIRLCRYSDGKWSELDTQKLSEDDTYLHFEASTPGFSPFAIVGTSMAQEGAEDVGALMTVEDVVDDTPVDDGSVSTEAKGTTNSWFAVGFASIVLVGGVVAMAYRKRE